MTTPQIAVRKADLDPSRPWNRPSDVSHASLVDSMDGSSPRLRTDVAAFHDGQRLLTIFSMEDDEVRASMYGRDEELWREDVVEIFLQPGEPGVYYEFQASPNGTLFDARVVFPGPTRESMTVDVGWDCEGFHASVRRIYDASGAGSLEIVVTIPFSSLVRRPPRGGDSWRANFYRIDRSTRGDSYAAWSPTLTPRPNFHVPRRFGTLVFT